MPTPRVLSQRNGMEVLFHPQPDGTFLIEHRQDVEAHLDRNKALQNHDDGYSPTRELRRAASIPDVIVVKWMEENGINVFDPEHSTAVKRKLNDPEWRWLRTAPGRL